MRVTGLDTANVERGPRRRKRAVSGRAAAQILFQLHQATGVTRGADGGVDPLIGGRAVACAAGDMGGVFETALMPVDDAHHCRLPQDGGGGAQFAGAQFLDEGAGAETADFLIVGQHDVDGTFQRPLRDLGGEGQNAGNEALHVTGPATVETPLTVLHDKGV